MASGRGCRMIRVADIRPAGTWAGLDAADTVVLDFDGRHRRRIALTGEGGLNFLLDLPEAPTLRDGDGLVLEDGRIVRVRAAPERLAEIRCATAGDLVRVAWHLGNRHLPTQLLGDRLRIREDHVILDMVSRLGAEVRLVEAPFDPEGGAYGHTHGHGHDHGHDHTHGHAHSHPHAHGDRGHD
ncbi:MAG TPA: urease accessory protein UreE [Microvirga sp.]|nr:urease accessory protein UreE [Microvirga sp.]